MSGREFSRKVAPGCPSGSMPDRAICPMHCGRRAEHSAQRKVSSADRKSVFAALALPTRFVATAVQRSVLDADR